MNHPAKTFPMASITLKGIPDELKERLQKLADRERRSLNQQAILLLERAIAEEPMGFERAYRRFRETHGPSPLTDRDLEGLRGEEEGRPIDL
jgi:predicted transcriptional regulator